jgi:outer membrane receptor protein involved in Fe transport
LCVGGCLIKNVRANILHAKDSETYREETEDNMLKKLVTVAIVFGMILYGATLTVKAAEEEQAEAVQTKEEQAEAVQAEGVQLEDSYVRPDYVEVERLKSTKNVIVIEKKDIEGKGYQNLSDVLNDNPSINVGVTGYGDIDIRGQGSDQAQRNIQVMLDGAPITTLTSHPFMNDYNYIPVDAIEKIEIIPGGGSVMYGSGAAGGVINITTNLKRMTKPVTSIQTTYGETGKDTTLNLGYKFTDKLTSQLTYTRSDKDLYFKNTWKDSNYLAGGLSYLINPQSRLRFRYSHLKDDGQFIASLQKKNFDKYGKGFTSPDGDNSTPCRSVSSKDGSNTASGVKGSSGTGGAKLIGGNFVHNGDGTYTALSPEGIDYTIVRSVEANYPEEARAVGYARLIRVKAAILVGLDGKVESVLILSNVPNLGFREAVRKALMQWRFSPIYYRGINIKMKFFKNFYFEPS